ncbi:MAG: hypothetical protein CMJ89_12290 [Planctomycetes bacterium]|nr:hypothetical protein [Planctomycetota bacterium]
MARTIRLFALIVVFVGGSVAAVAQSPQSPQPIPRPGSGRGLEGTPDSSVSFSDVLVVAPGATRAFSVSIRPAGPTATLTLGGTHASFLGGPGQVTVSDGDTFELVGDSQGPDTLAVSGPKIAPRDFDVVVRSTAFVIDGQCAVRNCPCTACGGTADRQDGAFVNLAVAGFMWRMSVLPSVMGRHGLAPSFVLHTNSRAYSQGGWFGTTPATLSCFERIRIDGNTYVYQEHEVREYPFDRQPIVGLPPGGSPTDAGGATTVARYEVMTDDSVANEVTIRRPDGTRLVFFGFSESSLTAGALKRIQNRFGDSLTYGYNSLGELDTVTDVYGREWMLSYDSIGRLSQIEEGPGLRGRSCAFTYDGDNRLVRIDTTAVSTDGGIGNTFPDGKPCLLTYGPASGNLATDTNIESVVYANQVLDGSLAPRITNTYGIDDRLISQLWGFPNLVGGTVTYFHGSASTTVIDRNGNMTVYSFGGVAGLATSVREETNRDVRGAGVDPASFETIRSYNVDQEMTALTMPEGNSITFEFDDASPHRFAHGNVLKQTQAAGPRGGDGLGSPIGDLVVTFTYEPIFQRVRTSTSPRGNDPTFAGPIPDASATVEPVDFDLDGVPDDFHASRYTTVTTYDYQESSPGEIIGLADGESIQISSEVAMALSTGELNQDGLTHMLGLPVQVRAPNVALEDELGTISNQEVIRNYRWNPFGLLREEIHEEGYTTHYTYSPEGNPNGRSGGSSDGGYPLQVIRDATTPQIRTPANPPPGATPIAATTTTLRDPVGNVITTIDPRGILHNAVYNEWNQVQVSTRAADASAAGVPSLSYRNRTFYDANNNVVKSEVENIVDVGGGTHQSVASNPWFTTAFTYDLLDNLTETVREVSEAGESRTIHGHSGLPWLQIGAGAEDVRTQRYYDRNQNLIATLSPLKVAGDPDSANNATTAIYDERDLSFAFTRGGQHPAWNQLIAHTDVVNQGLGLTFDLLLTASTRTHYDGNSNVVLSISAEDKGDPHNATEDQSAEAAGSPGILGDPSQTTYDGFDRAVRTRNAMDYETRTLYDPDSNAVQSVAIGPLGGNIRGMPASDPILSATSYEHDELSRVYLRRVADFGTGGFPQPPTPGPVVFPVELLRRTIYSPDSNAEKQVQPEGNVVGQKSFVATTFDALDRAVIRETNEMDADIGNPVTPSRVETFYDRADNVIQVIEFERSTADGSEEVFYTDSVYDAVNRAGLIIGNHFPGTPNPTANATRREYDSRGNVVASVDANASTSVDVSLNRGPGGASLLVSINSTGNAALSVHDGLGRVIATAIELRQDHDGALPLEPSSVNADGLIVNLQDWDENSRLVSVTDDEDSSQAPGPLNPSTTSYTHDGLDRRTVKTNADGETQSTGFDKDDNASTYTDENGSVFMLTFDDLSRVTQVSIAPAAGVVGTTLQTCEYDGLSRKTRCTDDNGAQVDSVVMCSYDSLSRKKNCDQKIGALEARSVTSEFDRNSNLIQLTYPGALGGAGRRKVTLGYRDSAGQTLNRIELIEEGAGSGSGNDIVPTGLAAAKIATYGYMGPVRIETRSYGNGGDGNGVLAEYTYDALRRLTRVTHGHPFLGGTFADFEYAFDRSGNRLNEIFHHQGVQDAYRYDSAGRMLREDRSTTLGGIANNQVANPTVTSAENRTWGIDGANNWNQVTGAGGFPSLSMTTNEMNEYDVVNTVARVHDANGNLTFDGTNLYAFDALNRLVRVTRISDGQVIAIYAYDHQGRRIRRTVTTGDSAIDEDTAYYYLGGQVLEELNPTAGTVNRQFVWDRRGNLLQYVDSVTIFSFLPFNVHGNGSGSTLFTTPQGAEFLANQRDYDAYGNFTELGGGLATVLPYAFRGWRSDPETGFYLLGGGVYYQPTLGRTLTRASASAASSRYVFNLFGVAGALLQVDAGNTRGCGGIPKGGVPDPSFPDSWNLRFIRGRFEYVKPGLGPYLGSRCCVDYFTVVQFPPRVRRVTVPGLGKRVWVRFPFDVYAEFANRGNCKPKCCQYRQYVKGKFKRSRFVTGGTPETPPGIRKVLSKDIYKEDNPAAPYGHRDHPQSWVDMYRPNRATGDSYIGRDEPGSRMKPGDRYDIDLSFRGRIIDTCNGDKTTAEAKWRVGGKGTVP